MRTRIGWVFFVGAVCLAGMWLSGCAAAPQIETVVQTKVVTPDVPAALLTCQAMPPIPAMQMQSQAADLLVQAYEAGWDCADHLAAVKQALAAPAAAK